VGGSRFGVYQGGLGWFGGGRNKRLSKGERWGDGLTEGMAGMLNGVGVRAGIYDSLHALFVRADRSDARTSNDQDEIRGWVG
jgi:hypothetical protein